MDREAAIRRINEAISRNYNSVSGYILHSSPWTTEEDVPALEALEGVKEEQERTASWLTTLLREEFGAGPTLRAFEYWKTDLNYLSVPYLVRFARDHFRRAAEEYAEALEGLGEEDAAMKAILSRLRDEAKKHAGAMEKVLPAPVPEDGGEKPADSPPAGS